MSIEQHQDFHQVRRILKVVAPGFRILANEGLEENQAVCDVYNKTIEVGEKTEITQAVGALLFQIGHLLLRHHPDYSLFFGQGLSQYKEKEKELIEKLSELGVKADQSASRWANEIFQAYWPAKDCGPQLIDRYKWSKQEWKEYFSE